MRRHLTLVTFAALFTLGLATSAWAQTTPPVVTTPPGPTVRLAWEHDGINLEGFLLYVDGTAITTPVATPPTGGKIGTAGTYTIPFPALTPGTHVLTVVARNAGVTGLNSAPSNPLTVSIIVLLNSPTGLRVITVTP